MSDGQLSFHCPGCKCGHGVYVDHPGPNRPVWEWNNSLYEPTFKPSIKIEWYDQVGPRHMICHSYVTDGKIEFLIDSTHWLAGQTVEIPDFEEVEP